MSTEELSRIIEMAWEDRTPFEAIKAQFGLDQQDVIRLMRSELKETSFKRWRKRTGGRSTKHLKKREFAIGRHKCSRQREISSNRTGK
jgi:uncharacterized protein (TIGR03643 family)